eukprot:PhF_6_TR20550/c0_g1_i1/m.29680
MSECIEEVIEEIQPDPRDAAPTPISMLKPIPEELPTPSELNLSNQHMTSAPPELCPPPPPPPAPTKSDRQYRRGISSSDVQEDIDNHEDPRGPIPLPVIREVDDLTRQQRKEKKKKDWSEWESSFEPNKVSNKPQPPQQPQRTTVIGMGGGVANFAATHQPQKPSGNGAGGGGRLANNNIHTIVSDDHLLPPKRRQPNGIEISKSDHLTAGKMDWSEWEKSFERGGHRTQLQKEEAKKQQKSSLYDYVRAKVPGPLSGNVPSNPFHYSQPQPPPPPPVRRPFVVDPSTLYGGDIPLRRRSTSGHRAREKESQNNNTREPLTARGPPVGGGGGAPSSVRHIQQSNAAVDDILVYGDRPRRAIIPASFRKRLAEAKKTQGVPLPRVAKT